MAVKFFGQFLIEQGEVDALHLREALDALERSNKSVGQLAVDRGFLDRAAAERVNRAQREQDRQWGDLAVEMKLMEHADLVECLREQRTSRLMTGEALVRLGHLSEDRLAPLLDAYKADQDAYTVGALQQLPDSLASNRIVPYVLDLLPKFARRIADVTVKVGAPQVLAESPSFRHRISLSLHGRPNLEITLIGDDEFCRRVAAATAGLAESELADAWVADGVGEFLSMICGNAMSALGRDGVETRLGAPDYDAELTDGWIFDLATSHGRAALLLSQF